MGTIVSETKTKQQQQHAVCIPFPVQGHVNPMMKLAKLLFTNGFHITYVNSEYNQRRLIKSRGPDSVKGLPSFRFKTIPDGLPPPSDSCSDGGGTQDVPALCKSFSENGLGYVRDLLAKLKEESEESWDGTAPPPPVTCIVTDGIMTFALEAAREIGIPGVVFWTGSACAYLAGFQLSQFIDKGITPLKDTKLLTNGYLDTEIDWIPGMEGLRIRDFPSQFITTDPDDYMLKFIQQETQRARNEASAVIINTFQELELRVLHTLSSYLPRIYCLGPLQLLGDSLKSIGSNLWKQEPDSIDYWLDSKPPNSVVYVNFGSITVVTAEQLVELGWGLANSGQNFLCVIRPDLVLGESAVLPPELVEETKNRGLFPSWCDQERVLGHPSIGVFLTHSGWNSTLEGIINGVPMICWPFFSDQPTNCWFSCNKWGIAMGLIDSDVKRNGVEELARKLMEGVEGKKLKKNVMELKSLAEEAAIGRSPKNLENLIQNVLLTSPKC